MDSGPYRCAPAVGGHAGTPRPALTAQHDLTDADQAPGPLGAVAGRPARGSASGRPVGSGLGRARRPMSHRADSAAAPVGHPLSARAAGRSAPPARRAPPPAVPRPAGARPSSRGRSPAGAAPRCCWSSRSAASCDRSWQTDRLDRIGRHRRTVWPPGWPPSGNRLDASSPTAPPAGEAAGRGLRPGGDLVGRAAQRVPGRGPATSPVRRSRSATRPRDGQANLFTNFHVVESVWDAGGRKVFLERGRTSGSPRRS